MQEQETTHTTPNPAKPRNTGTQPAKTTELHALQERCARQRKELERLKAIVTVASTSDVESVIIVKQPG